MANIKTQLHHLVEDFPNGTIDLDYQRKIKVFFSHIIQEEQIEQFLVVFKEAYLDSNFDNTYISILRLILMVFLPKERVKPIFIQNFLNLLKSDSKPEVITGLVIIRDNSNLLILPEFFDEIIHLFVKQDVELEPVMLSTLKQFAYSHNQQLIPYFDHFVSIISNTQQEYSKAYAMQIVGDMVLGSNHRQKLLTITESQVHAFLIEFSTLSDIRAKTIFLEGLGWIFTSSSFYRIKWIEILIQTYTNISDISLRSIILRSLYLLPTKKGFSSEAIQLYLSFFESELKIILNAQALELPEDSVIVTPNQVQDVLQAFEQLSFEIPEMVEQLLDIFLQIVERISPQYNENSFRFSILYQNIRSIYQNLANYYKSRDSRKVITYLKAAIPYSPNDLVKLEFEITVIQHEISILIKDKQIPPLKVHFNELNSKFDSYSDQKKEIHKCEPAWKIMECVFNLINCEELERSRNFRILDDNLDKYSNQLGTNFQKSIEKWKVVVNKKTNLASSSNYIVCQQLFYESMEILGQLFNEIKESTFYAIKSFILELKECERTAFKDLASQKGINLLIDQRYRMKLPNDPLLNTKLDEVANFIKSIDLMELFPEKLPDENKEINPKLMAILKTKFNKVEMNKGLSGNTHIDIFVDDEIIIEVKKLESNTAKDELVGQITEDFRQTSCIYAIGLGIDITAKKIWVNKNMTYEKINGKVIKYVILPYQKM